MKNAKQKKQTNKNRHHIRYSEILHYRQKLPLQDTTTSVHSNKDLCYCSGKFDVKKHTTRMRIFAQPIVVHISQTVSLSFSHFVFGFRSIFTSKYIYNVLLSVCLLFYFVLQFFSHFCFIGGKPTKCQIR